MQYDEDSISNKSQTLTLILLLFFGSFGAHRFYVRKYITGLLYLIIGSTTIVIDLFGFGYAFLSKCVYVLFILVDLYALYSDSFTDKAGKMVIGKTKYMVYDSETEREHMIFNDILTKVIYVLAGLAVYIIYFVITRIVI